MPEPLLREPLARALHRNGLAQVDPDVVLAALAADQAVVTKVRRLLDRRIQDWGGYAGDNYLDQAAAEDAVALFGEPR